MRKFIIKNIRKVKRFFDKCLYKRLDELAEEFQGTKKYLDLSSREQQLFEEIEKHLPESLKLSLIRYSDTLNELMAEEQEYYYHKGFSDCYVFINKILSRT